jgi:hypothetical protein
MITFDQVLPETIAAVESSIIAQFLTKVTVIRDLEGRVRLVLEFRQPPGSSGAPPYDSNNWQADKTNLENTLATKLAHYWGATIWRDTAKPKEFAFAALKKTIEAKRQRWISAPGASNNFEWYKLEQQYSRTSWVTSNLQPPWTLTDTGNEPAIISFYSFKGGVGRTVATAATAILLARAGKDVVLLDLDLEAPGLRTLMLGKNAPQKEGIVDYLVERQVRKVRPNDIIRYTDIVTDPRLVGGNSVRILGAGVVDSHFIEKIARLDFNIGSPDETSPIHDLLNHVKDEFKPNFILLDVRSGIHDLGGLSLNGLSHLDVLFGRDDPQGWAGLSVVLGLLGEAKPPRRPVLVVHAQAPKNGADEDEVDPAAHQQFLDESYKAFETHYYRGVMMPDIKAPDAPYGVPLVFKEVLHRQSDIHKIAKGIDKPHRFYIDLVRRMGELLGRETVK